jgi:hypothetical protein
LLDLEDFNTSRIHYGHILQSKRPFNSRELLDSRLGGSVPRVLRVFLRILGIRLAELQIDPQLESTIRTKARGLHSIWNIILRIAFSIWFFIKAS